MRRGRKGLTLVELLVAVAILAIVAGLIVAPLMTGMKLTIKGQARIDSQDAVRMAIEQMSRELAEAVEILPNNNPSLGAFNYVDFFLPETDRRTGELLLPVRPDPEKVIRYYTMLRLMHDDPSNPDATNYDPDTNPYILYRAEIPLSEYGNFAHRHPTAEDRARGVFSSSITPKGCDVKAFRVWPALVRNDFLKPLDGSSTRFVAKFPLWLWNDSNGNDKPENGEGFWIVVLDQNGVPLDPQPEISEILPERGVVDFGFYYEKKMKKKVRLEGRIDGITGDGTYTGTNMSAEVNGRWVEAFPEGPPGARFITGVESLSVKEGTLWTVYERVASGQGLPEGRRWYRVDPDPNAPLGVKITIHLPRDILPGETWAIRLSFGYTFLPDPSTPFKVVATYRTYALLDLFLSLVKYDVEGKPQGARLTTRVRVENASPEMVRG